MEEDIIEVIDRGEAVSMIEPLLISGGSEHRAHLNDLALDLAAHSARFRGSLPKYVEHSLADLVRAMNCYYSNLIEGHDTHPVDIERALKPVTTTTSVPQTPIIIACKGNSQLAPANQVLDAVAQVTNNTPTAVANIAWRGCIPR
jgi:hypothetical protein